jgi:hypothetical protein
MYPVILSKKPFLSFKRRPLTLAFMPLMGGRHRAVALLAFAILLGVVGPALSGDPPPQTDPAGGAAPSSPPTSEAEENPALAAAVAEMTDIRDIKPPQIYGRGIPWLAVAAAGAAALLAFWIWRKRRGTGALAAAEPPAPAHERALAALAALRQNAGLPDKAVYFELSAILRDYIDQRFRLDTLEMTTEELLPVIRELPTRAELRSALADLFRFADPVKYADASVGESQRVADLGFADDFVRATRAAPEAADV